MIFRNTGLVNGTELRLRAMAAYVSQSLFRMNVGARLTLFLLLASCLRGRLRPWQRARGVARRRDARDQSCARPFDDGPWKTLYRSALRGNSGVDRTRVGTNG